MTYLGTQTDNLIQNKGIYSPKDILKLNNLGHWGGSLHLLAEQSFSSGSTSAYDFTDIQEDRFDIHVLYTQFDAGGLNGGCGIRLFENGVLEDASVYERYMTQVYDTGTGYDITSASAANIGVGGETTLTGKGGFGVMYLYNLGNPNTRSWCTYHAGGEINNGQWRLYSGAGNLPQTSKVDGIRVYSSVAFVNGFIKLYGLKDISNVR